MGLKEVCRQIEKETPKYLSRDDEDDERHETKTGRYHASKGGYCIRKRFYYDEDVPHDKPYGVFERGEKVEEYVEDLLVWIFGEENVGNSLSVEHPKDEMKIVGETDPYIEYNGDRYITEVKSVRNLQPTNLPYVSHKHQLNTYLTILDLDGFFIYVESGDFGNIEIIPFEQDDKLWKTTVMHHNLYHGYRKSGDLPEKMPMHDKECDQCPFLAQCNKDYAP